MDIPNKKTWFLKRCFSIRGMGLTCLMMMDVVWIREFSLMILMVVMQGFAVARIASFTQDLSTTNSIEPTTMNGNPLPLPSGKLT